MSTLSLHDHYPLPDQTRSVKVAQTDVTVISGNCLPALLGFLKGADAVLGAVAWVRNYQVLSALLKRPAVMLVQKEEYWKMGARKEEKIRSAYIEALHNPSGIKTRYLPLGAKPLVTKSDLDLPRFGCIGYGPSVSYRPLMHNKFIIAARLKDEQLTPYAVWTGSFNFSQIATTSLENAVIIESAKAARAYLAEWVRLLAMAEPLNWKNPNPQVGRLLEAC